MECKVSTRARNDDDETATELRGTTPPKQQIASPDSVSYPVPFGHVPYSPSLPGAMGVLPDFPTEWWYYGGWAYNKTKNKYFTILIVVTRHRLTPSQSTAAIMYGIDQCPAAGPPSIEPILKNTSEIGSFGPAPTPTPNSWSLEANASTMKVTTNLNRGILGLSGAQYTLKLTDSSPQIFVEASFILEDTLGMVLEIAAPSSSGKGSYEFAMPCLNIKEGSTIAIGTETTELGGGNLWLDRQTLSTIGNGEGKDVASLFAQARRFSNVEADQLYTGNWIPIFLDDGSIYLLVFFWPQKKDQWIVGTKVGHPPIGKIGIQYFRNPEWNKASPVQGVQVLDDSEFDLNILNPNDPQQSPHWTSPTSKHTYCSAWQLEIRGNLYNMHAFLPGSEVGSGSAACFEGAAKITKGKDIPVGTAMVEQMGYTQ